jgi:hypothetical protein
MVFHLFTFRVYLTFEKAVTLIFKHATHLRLSNKPESALTYAELGYQKANVDVTIQQHLITHGLKHSVEQFADFIMNTDISLCILPFVTFISYHPFSSSTKWLKHFLKADAKSLFFVLRVDDCCYVLPWKWLTHKR